MLPNRIYLSTQATERLKYIKSATGVTPNIIARIAIMLAIKDETGLGSAGIKDFDGQELNQSVLFGDHFQVYDVMINQYLADHNIDVPVAQAIAAMVEVGIHKMGHAKKVDDLCNFAH